MSPSQRRPAAKSDRRITADPTRARILQSALESFARNGFHGTSTRMIASLAGISPGAVYVHHQSKEELLFQLSLEGHQEALDVVVAAAAAATPEQAPGDRLAVVMADFAAWHARRHTIARVVQYELAALTAEHHAVIAKVRRRTRDVVRGIVDDGIRTGEFEVDKPDLATVALLSLGIDVARWYRPGAWTPEEIGRYYADLALHVVRHRPADK
ncbi:TetR/AcrR family transcriptional regulator [Flexivirga oryzae]|uniref:AcrR family transcriptional regulator n=1 Tax=Flexivirga oryzae TaxID=1794944 RepID=A0A839N6T0_9MICO|nr:TetR/AcrR family transcriptional regulator [Flexivirga oryzae]MBB2892469.1 AcrR family transcriptional regulator [Flexivirga oryzae]